MASQSMKSVKQDRKRSAPDVRKRVRVVEEEEEEADANVEDSTPRKVKKPKHLNRKIAQAQQLGDNDTVNILKKQADELMELKTQRVSQWETLCKKLVGSDKWDQGKFDRLMQTGLNKKKMLEALGVERQRDTKKKKDPKALKRKTVSRNKKKLKKLASKDGAGGPAPKEAK